MPTRRFDPQRRDRIVEAALDLIAEQGVAGTSHRKVAARADVPLGSMTYHFDSMDALLREAFARFAEGIAARFEVRMTAAQTHAQAVAAVVDIVHSDLVQSNRELVLTHELYTLAARDRAYRELTRDWMGRSRTALERHFDARTARELDALIEGLTLHRALDTEPHDRETTADAVARVAGIAGRPGTP
jgi:DNA-binding transcriptional regulator YbjK